MSAEITCPECDQGKHDNCGGDALDEVRDEITTCDCYSAGHERCCHCGDLLYRRDCDDGLNHCGACRRDCHICAPEDRRWEAADEARALAKEGE